MTQAAKCALGLAAIGIAAGVALLPARSAQFTCEGGFTHTTHVATLAGTQTTSSTTPVDLPGAAVSFTPGTRCLTIEVSGQVRAVSPNGMRISIVATGGDGLDDPPFPAFRDIYTETTALDGRSVTFWVNLLEGDKDVKVQFRSINGSPVSLIRGVVIFKYNIGT